MNKLNKLTEKLYPIIDALLLGQPNRTVLGGLVGGTLWALILFFGPLLQQFSWIAPNAVPPFLYFVVGITVLHIPTIITRFRESKSLDEQFSDEFKLIDRAKREGASDARIGQMYLDIVESLLQRVTLKEKAREELKD